MEDKWVFKGMKRYEAELWRKHVQRYHLSIDRWEYNKPIARKRAIADDSLMTPWLHKVDVYSETEAYVYFYEIKEVANAEALGQVILYADIIRDMTEHKKGVIGWVVATRIAHDAGPTFQKFGIGVVLEAS